ncbi:MAG TPA: TrkH family potassium uptake protein [Candidatus Avilachnospira avicola]|nr:TrkH family potassium uptake protein [Candidatus Avilachnospira avicola]
MEISIVIYIIGLALMIEGALMIVPGVCALIYGESLMPYILTAAICLIIGVIFTRRRPESGFLFSREGYVATGLTWIALAFTGMLPFLFSGSTTSVADAVFETVSGYTTTGSSIFTAVEDLPKGILMWRSFMHWIGGMGILVFMLAIVPFSGGTQMNIMKAESPGPSISKIVPRAQDSAKILYQIYTAMTIVMMVTLIVLRMPVFDAICITFGAAGTGGFSVLNTGCATYTIAQQIVITVGMIAFGVNFSFYYFLLIKKLKLAFSMEEVRAYILIILASIGLITVDLVVKGIYQSGPIALKDAAFHVGSIITTTGYATTDCNTWPALSQGILIVLMFIGACAGSTGGGIKVSRVLMMLKAYKRELAVALHPNIVKKVHMDGKAADEIVLRNTGVYIFIYFVIFTVSVLIVSLDGFDWLTTFTSVAATYNNIGPGFGVVGTMGNFSSLSDLSKWVLSLDMLIGRLEIFPIMLLFVKNTWRKF